MYALRLHREFRAVVRQTMKRGRADNCRMELSAEDRRQVLKNMNSIILASNRRVDIVLSTTGQQSQRQYPFNAKDFLPLISTQGEPTNKETTQKH